MNTGKKALVRIVLVLSLVGNAVWGIAYFLDSQTAPLARVGVLTQDVVVGSPWDKPGSPLIHLPKGLVVRDTSPRSIAASDLFEPNRFSITVGTNTRGIVDYEGSHNLKPDEYRYSIRGTATPK